MITTKVTREQHSLVRRLLEGHSSAQKNWIASAVESGDGRRARRILKELRQTEALFHVFVPDDMIKED